MVSCMSLQVIYVCDLPVPYIHVWPAVISSCVQSTWGSTLPCLPVATLLWSSSSSMCAISIAWDLSACATSFKRTVALTNDFVLCSAADFYITYCLVARIMKLALPDNAKIAKEAKECMQECVSEYISFITSEGM